MINRSGCEQNQQQNAGDQGYKLYVSDQISGPMGMTFVWFGEGLFSAGLLYEGSWSLRPNTL
jgi:hypothetical protein